MTEDGLLFAGILNGKGGTKTVTWPEIRDWKPSDGILWLHLDRTAPDVERWVREESGVDEAVAETLLAASGNRPRVQRIGGALLIILRGINLNEGEERHDMVGLHLWITDHLIVTLRRRRLMAGNAIAEELRRGDGPHSAGDFLVHLTGFMTDHTAEVVDAIDDDVDQIQKEVLETEGAQLRTRLRRVRQTAIELRRYLAPQRDALLRLPNERVEWLNDLSRSHLREIADRNARFVEDLDSARERAAVTQEEINTQLADRMNKTMYVIAIVSVIFLPPALLTGLFGINVGGMPWLESPFGFSLIAVGLFALAGLELWILRRLKWI